MKKIILLYLIFVSYGMGFAQNNKDFLITDDGNGNLTITKYEGWDLNVNIPARIDGKQVIAIGNNAFTRNDLTGVILPEGLKRIGINAFSSNKLTNIRIPNSVITIEANAFSSNQITDIVIGNAVISIGDSAFAGNKITNITFGRNVATIGVSVFGTTILSKVNMPENSIVDIDIFVQT